ncbi:hypothetical protein F5Y00DRAFT_83233 [Daldinia vernicosa]|uniref:uncharacterized protein n=1 Tax=Daldinia vernicosa TaxID=114800 RepID=UPI00200770F4|nr:uncharacterized protein F5Y00DRAFT_83233 [Daldinia vernicosa]KAI0848601.1 hypothetical protein F5Y00DRAFT_83233 [Daldinia vernicosa]
MAISYEVAQKVINKKHLYCRLVDTDQFQKLQEEVTLPDATFTFYSDGKIMNEGGVEFSWSSAADWAKYFENRLKNSQVIHHIAPPHLEQISPDEVKAVFGVQFSSGPKGSPTEGHYSGGGYYHELYVRKGDDWFLKELKMHSTYFRVG